jgi:hypothetical protein
VPSGRPRPRTIRAPWATACAASARTVLCTQHATLRLQQYEGEIVAPEARIKLRRARVEMFRGDALRGQRALRRRLPPVLAVGKPGHAAFDEQLLARFVLEFAPERSRATRHLRVFGVGPCAQR